MVRFAIFPSNSICAFCSPQINAIAIFNFVVHTTQVACKNFFYRSCFYKIKLRQSNLARAIKNGIKFNYDLLEKSLN